jgi:DNA-binding transcriptional LysR family regulator
MGVAHLMKCTVQADLEQGHLIQVLPQLRLPSLPLQSMHAFGRLTPARVRLFTDFVAREMQRIVAG